MLRHWRSTAWSGLPKRRPHVDLAAFAVLLLLGFFFRIWSLPSVPSGLTWDEAAEGLEAARLFRGEFPIFFPEHGGHEPLLIYLQAASLRLFGWSAFSLRLPSVFLTTLALAASFLVARRLFDWQVACLATVLQATALWQVIMSRLAIRPAALILFGALAVYWLVQWLDSPEGWRPAVFCGLFTGTATYVYTPGRFLVGVIGLAWLAALAASPKRLALVQRGAAAGGVAALVFAPLGWYFAEHPGTFTERASELSIFNPTFGPPLVSWLRSVEATVLMFFAAGEPGWDKNIAHRPMFDPFLATLFAAGLLLALWRWRRPGNALAIAWLAMMALPLTLTAKDLPDFGRVSGIAPAVFLFPAIAAAAAWRRWPSTAWLLGAGSLALAGASYWQFFGEWEHAAGKAESYRPGVLDAGQSAIDRLTAPSQPGLVFVGAPEAYDAVAEFLIAGFQIEHPDLGWRLVGYNARYTQVAPPPGTESYLMAPGRPAITSAPTPRTRTNIVLADAVAVRGYDLPQLARPGETLTFRVHWEPLRGVNAPITFFAHLLDYSGNQTLAGFDHNGFPPELWHGGERVTSSFPLAIRSETPPGAYWVEFGAYTSGGRRLLNQVDEEQDLLGPVIVTPEAVASEAPVGRLEQGVGLLSPAVRRSGDGLDVDLRWLPSRRLEREYSVFVHVLDAAGKLVAQADGPPAGGRWPTLHWLPNVPVEDSRHVALPAGLPTGTYQVTAGLYQLQTGERLPAEPAGPEPGSLLVGEVALGG